MFKIMCNIDVIFVMVVKMYCWVLHMMEPL